MDNAPSDSKMDESLFASLPGGRAVIDWFGFCPDFHDGSLERLELFAGQALVAIRTCRWTSEVDAKGFHRPDRHALVIFRMEGVTGVQLQGDAGSIIGELTVRRLHEAPDRLEWQSCPGPAAGDLEIAFDTAMGLYGSIYSKSLALEIQPLEGISTP